MVLLNYNHINEYGSPWFHHNDPPLEFPVIRASVPRLLPGVRWDFGEGLGPGAGGVPSVRRGHRAHRGGGHPGGTGGQPCPGDGGMMGRMRVVDHHMVGWLGLVFDKICHE